ncbi:EAL domain-containing protein [Actinotalea ferrariae]|uniref:putative bifunctional diguanylate cyclase/phosphodiesterase n=1 Tax=Actinotalea ferrariae TaxID=1386098 RepID=UPI001C8C55A6|nr:EAL domain-containing protein [Actinotalea ferrariae]MBX9246061.1 EAL domain-containing protein [Actinotalea ferrariae]
MRSAARGWTGSLPSALPWAVLAVGATTTLFMPGTEEDPAIRSTLVVTLSVFFAVLLGRLLLVARRERHRRVPLVVLAGAIGLWAVGSASVSLGQTVGAVTFPAPGEILCLASYVGLAAFLLLDARRRPTTTAAVWLEAAVICGASVCLAAFAVLTPLSGAFAAGGLTLLLAILFPLMNLLLAALVLAQALLHQRARTRRTLALMAGFVGLAVADCTFIVAIVTTQTYSASLTMDALWGGSFALVVGAACAPRGPEVAGPAPRPAGAVLVTGAALAVVLLVLDPAGAVGWVIKGFAIATLLTAGARTVLALNEARGAAEALRLSLTDELTGLPNRRALVAAGDDALRRGRPVGVMLLDVDGFKDINDSLGHSVGDDVLVTLGHRLRATLDAKVVVARLGGDEFAVLAEQREVLALFDLAQQVRTALASPLRVAGMDLILDASVGIATREDDTASATELLRRADIAMYEAKQARCGVLLFDSSQDGVAAHRLRQGEALRAGIASGQLVVWYQPQIDARTRQVVAVEALVRWAHPTDGLLSPVSFLPDARRSGLMGPLTETVMRQVIADTLRWRAAGLTFRVAMNWAPPELVGGALLPKLFEALDESGLPADCLLIEVTEDSFLADPERARAALHQLRAHGVGVSIDDYGTGFSSLAYLRDLPVEELKMDRSFVRAVATDERSRMIVQSTTQMARALGLRLVAEGVEDHGAATHLVPLGVDVLQGYHIGRPMPAQAIDPWVREWALGTAVVPHPHAPQER